MLNEEMAHRQIKKSVLIGKKYLKVSQSEFNSTSLKFKKNCFDFTIIQYIYFEM